MSIDFVNDNRPNVNVAYIADKHYTMLELIELSKQFQDQIKAFTATDSESFPVIRYKYMDEYVAWYDLENCVGYIADGHTKV